MSEWIEAILSEHIGLRHGYQFRETDFTDSGIQVIKIGNVTSDGLSLNTHVSYVSSLREKEFESIIIRDGDILMSLTGNIGRVVEVNNLNKRILFQNYRVGVFYPLKDNIFKPFIKWILSSEEILRQLNSNSNQSAQANFGKQDLDKLKFKIPSIAEQKKISFILDKAEVVIEKTQVAIAKYKAIKQGVLDDLFTRGIDIKTGKLRPSYADAPELYKDSALGWIPKEWVVNCLEELVDIDSEQLPTSTDANFSFYYIDISSVSTGTITYSPNRIEFKNSPSRARKVMRFNDVLLATVRPNLKAFAQFKRESIYPHIASTGFAVLHEKKNTDIDFVFQTLLSDYIEKQIDAVVVGSNYPAINSKDVRDLKVMTPIYSEQKTISKKILAIDQKIQSEQTYLQKLQQLKSGLMSDLLSGKKLVTISESIEPQTT